MADALHQGGAGLAGQLGDHGVAGFPVLGADLDLDHLDGDIYRDTADVDLDNNGRIDDSERDVRRYDNDLESADD